MIIFFFLELISYFFLALLTLRCNIFAILTAKELYGEITEVKIIPKSSRTNFHFTLPINFHSPPHPFSLESMVPRNISLGTVF